MATKIQISNLEIEVIKKNIKNIHLGVYPPNGEIRVSAPLKVNDETLRIFLISKLSWIHKQIKKFSNQERQTKREYVSGESHYFLGKRYLLSVNQTDKNPKIQITKTSIELFIMPNTTIYQKEKMFEIFYRDSLTKIIPDLLKKWGKKTDVNVKEVRIKKMKTKWGTCNNKDRRIWLNLELAKKTPHCIDYIFVHELIHLIEKNHTDKFFEILDDIMPKWQSYKDELNQDILGHFTWTHT